MLTTPIIYDEITHIPLNVLKTKYSDINDRCEIYDNIFHQN